MKDVDADAWYAEDLQKAVYMGTMKLDTYMRPDDSITRQEAFTVLARAFKMTDGTVDDLSGFADNNLVAGWAVPGVGALVNGYVKGRNCWRKQYNKGPVCGCYGQYDKTVSPKRVLLFPWFRAT